MDLLPTGFKNKSKKLLLIDTELFSLNIIGKDNRKEKRNINNFDKPAYFDIESKIQLSKVETIQSDGKLANNSGNVMYPCFFDDGNYQIFIKNKTENELNLFHIEDRITNNISKIDGHIICNLEFNGEAGYSNFRILVNGQEVIKFTIEIFPGKLDYYNDYIKIMEDVNEEIANLAYEFLGSTFHNANLKDTNYQTENEFFYILKNIYSKFKKALSQIEKRPKHKLLNKHRVKDVNKAKNISKKTISYLRKNPQKMVEDNEGISFCGGSYLPTEVIEKENKITYDIFENRYIKYILKKIRKRIRNIKQKILNRYKEKNERYKMLKDIEQNITRKLKGFYSKVGELKKKKSSNLIFQMAPGYKEVYHYYTMLQKGLDLSDDFYNITPKKIWNLYETWCYIKLNQILKELGYNISEYGIIKAKDNGLYLSVVYDEESVMRYENDEGDEIELWYNKIYSSLPTTGQRPDNVLCLNSKIGKERLYVFDAKYRISISDNEIVGPKEEDINVMHRYRDSIVNELNNQNEFSYKTFGAYVMFPCSNEKAYKKHKFYESIDKVNIGAFPMLPGNTNLIKEHLKDILVETEIEAEEKIIEHDTKFNLNKNYKFNDRNVMIVNVKDPKHLQCYKENLFFHIPNRALSDLPPGIKYLAFYQPQSNFKPSKSGIKYWAEIEKSRKYRRKECDSLNCTKKKEEQIYLRIELKKINELNQYIKNVEYGPVLFNYTTLYLLKNAENYHELQIETKAEIYLYKILKRISRKYELSLKRYSNHYMIGKNKIKIIEDNKVKINNESVKLEQSKIENIIEE